MYNGYVLLAEKEPMWAQMLMEVLEDNNIPCASLPVHGAALVHKTGKQERLRVYVPSENLQQASDLLHILFSGTFLEEQAEPDAQTEI